MNTKGLRRTCLFLLTVCVLSVPVLKGDEKPAGLTEQFLAAARAHNLDALRELHGKHPDIAKRHDRTGTALHQPNALGRLDVIRALLKMGADPNSLDGVNVTPLCVVARNTKTLAADLLLDAGADINRRHTKQLTGGKLAWGMTPLDAAANRAQISMVRHLLERGAKHTLEKGTGNSLHWAYLVPNLASDAEEMQRKYHKNAGNRQVIDLLIEHGADVNLVDQHGRTPLIQAIHWLSVDTVSYLVEERDDVEVNLRPSGYPQALIYAISSSTQAVWLPEAEQTARRLAIVRSLLKAGADPELPYDPGSPNRTGKSATELCKDAEIKNLLLQAAKTKK